MRTQKLLSVIAILLLGIFGLASGWQFAKAQALVHCHQFKEAAEFPETDDFGSPFNPFSEALENMIVVICNAPNSTVQIGYGQQNQYIFEDAYVWRNHAWQRFNLSGPVKDRTWFVGKASGNFATTETELAQANYVVSYICHYTNELWRCGCKNQNDCRPSRWNLQEFSGPPVGATGPQVTLTVDKPTVRLGESITLTWNAVGAQSCVAYGDWQGNKPPQGTETLNNITSARRYQLQCDGQGGSNTATQQVSMQ